jgi:hypothetical protein
MPLSAPSHPPAGRSVSPALRWSSRPRAGGTRRRPLWVSPRGWRSRRCRGDRDRRAEPRIQAAIGDGERGGGEDRPRPACGRPRERVSRRHFDVLRRWYRESHDCVAGYRNPAEPTMPGSATVSLAVSSTVPDQPPGGSVNTYNTLPLAGCGHEGVASVQTARPADCTTTVSPEIATVLPK